MSTHDKAREERLAAALRENLRRRKAQARANASAPANAGALPEGAEAQKKEPNQPAKE